MSVNMIAASLRLERGIGARLARSVPVKTIFHGHAGWGRALREITRPPQGDRSVRDLSVACRFSGRVPSEVQNGPFLRRLDELGLDLSQRLESLRRRHPFALDQVGRQDAPRPSLPCQAVNKGRIPLQQVCGYEACCFLKGLKVRSRMVPDWNVAHIQAESLKPAGRKWLLGEREHGSDSLFLQPAQLSPGRRISRSCEPVFFYPDKPSGLLAYSGSKLPQEDAAGPRP